MNDRDFVFIKAERKYIKLFLNDITVIKGLGNYVEIYTLYDKKYVHYQILNRLIDMLPGQFMRIHNSHIVNLVNIGVFEDNHIICKDLKVAVSKGYHECLLNALKKFML